MKGLRNLKLIATALLVLCAIGVAGFHYLEGWPWFDGLYMVLTTFTTIGYGEVHPLSHTGRIFNSFLIVCGVLLVFLLIGTITQVFLEFELSTFFGRRRMEREIGRLKGHYIICGAGRVGRRVASEFELNHAPFVLIEGNAQKATTNVPEGWLTIVGDASHEDVLRSANIKDAAGLVAATTTDATNVYVVLTARAMNPSLHIVARASEETAEKHLLTAGANAVVSPYHFAGHRIAQAFLRPHVLDFLDSATVHLGIPLEIAQVKVASGSPYAGKTIASSHIRHDTGVIVLAIKRGEKLHVGPNKDDAMEAGDYLIVMGDPTSLRKLEELASSAVKA
jgi:voltage-gated potassium channel